MALDGIKTQPYTSVLTQQKALIHGIVRAVAYAWREALERNNEFRPPNDLGYQLYGSIVEHVSRFLVELGFERLNRGCQVRLIRVEESLDTPLRVLFCKGKKHGMDVHVHKKGPFSIELIKQNQPLSSQPILDLELENIPEFDEDTEAFQNFWLIWEPSELNVEVFTLYLALPEAYGPSGTLFRCAELVELHCGSAFDVPAATIEMPEGTKITPIVEEVEHIDAAE